MPDDTSRRSERVPEKTHPLAAKHQDNVNPDLRDAKGRPLRANRQDGPLGDVSPRDETR